MKQLSKHIEGLILKCFTQMDQDEARRILTIECSDKLPLIRDNLHQVERVQAATIKLASGDIGRLRDWTSVAQEDWRDVLGEAGFYASEDAHLRWEP